MGILSSLSDSAKRRKNGTGGGIPLIDPKASFRTEEQEKAVFYFSPENVKPADFKGCAKGCSSKIKGCFPKKKKGCFPKKKEGGCFSKKGGGCFPKKGEGCFPKGRYMPDEEYDALVRGVVARLDPNARGLRKLVLDESEVERTITFANYKYSPIFKEGYYERIGEDGKFRSSVFEVTNIYFTQNQMAVYKLILSSEWEQHDERTFEYHYKDITAFSTLTHQEDTLKDDKDGGKKKEYRTVQNEFLIVVPGDSFSVSLGNKPTEEEESAIQGMKSLLREKKA